MRRIVERIAFILSLASYNLFAPVAALAQNKPGDPINPNPPSPNPPDGGGGFTVIGMDPWVAILLVVAVVLVVGVVAMAVSGSHAHTDTHVHH